MKTYWMACLLVAACTSALAEDVALSPEFDRCEKAAGGETFRLLDCQSKEFARQDKRLNEDYRHLLSKLSANKGSELKRVQRAWAAYVKPKCDFYFDNTEFNGQADRLGASRCEMVERARRAIELEQLSNRYQ